MFARLQLHPDSRCDAVENIEVEAVVENATLLLRYRLNGTIADIRLPEPTDPARADGLWQHTCFEAFARRGGDAAYREFNFSPSTQWAAYRFDDYRKGLRQADIAAPLIEAWSGDGSYELLVRVELPVGACQLGVSAVIEETNGRKSYWALAHPPGKADFHHPDSFVLQLSAAS